MWKTFREHLSALQYQYFINKSCVEVREELVAHICENEQQWLQEAAVERLIERFKKEKGDKLRRKAEKELITQYGGLCKFKDQLKNELRLQAEQELKRELLENPVFIAEVKDELKRQLLGL
jgi:hypothetical protein